MNLFTSRNRVSGQILALFTALSMIISFLPFTATVASAATTSTISATVVANPTVAPEYFEISYTGTASLNLSGWSVEDGVGTVYTFGATTLTNGNSFRVCQNTGDQSACDANTGSASANWNNTGDTFTLNDNNGETILEFTFGAQSADQEATGSTGSLTVLGTTGGDKITICHKTSSEENPYTNPDVSVNSFFSSGHDADQNDVIPPFFYNQGEGLKFFKGTNWDADGQALLRANCVVAAPDPILGCTDDTAINYDSEATQDDGSCEYDVDPILGCTDDSATNYNPEATEDDGSCEFEDDPILGCTDIEANNYNPEATEDDKSCLYDDDPILGCTDDSATNYNPEATEDDGSCEFEDNQCVPEGPAWATVVEFFVQGDKKNGSPVAANRSDADDVLGEPDWTEGGNTGFTSLGFGGVIKVAFDGLVWDAEGDDISIHEATNGATYPLETAKVEVSQDGDVWYALTEEARNDNNEGGDGVTLVDFSETGLEWILFVKITDTSDPSLHNQDADGFDLDAVDVTLVGCDEPDPEPIYGCTNQEALNFNPSATVDDQSCVFEPVGACEIEGHKYDATGSPLKDWFIGLKKFATFGEEVQEYTIMSDLTDEDGYYCLEWDEADFSEVEYGYDSYIYRVFEKIKDGWKLLSIEEGSDIENLEVVADEDIWYGDDEAGVQLGEENGFIDVSEYHIDFYNLFEDGYGPYCGNNVQEDWEQCDDGVNGSESCTASCTFTNQCSVLQLAKVNLDSSESPSFDGKVYLGSASNPIPAGTWFKWDVAGDDPVQDIADVVDGLAVERDQTNGLQVAFRGGNASRETDIVAGSVEFMNLKVGELDRYIVGSLGSGYELEDGVNSFLDVWDRENSQLITFDLRADTGNDGATAEITVDEDAIAECRYTLTVEITGEGFGGVSSTDQNIQCSTLGGEENMCSFTYAPGTVVDLTALADEGSNFDNSWTLGFGTCTGNTSPCQVTMNSDVDLVAHFDLNNTIVTTTRGGAGRKIELGGGSSSNDEEEEEESENLPTPLVAGEQVSVVPFGAPNAGAGGTSPSHTPAHGTSVVLGMVAIAASIKRYVR